MTTFLLMRHGETDAVGKSIMGWKPGWRLNPRGRDQAQRLAEAVSVYPIAAIYTSPLERAVETAEFIAARHGLRPEPVEDLGEVRVGEWEGQLIADLDRREDWRRYNTFRSGERPPGGELMIETQTRIVRALACFRSKHAEQTVAVVSHGDPLRAAVAHFLGIPLDLMLRFEIATASLSVVEVGGWGPRVLCVNRTEEVPR